MSPYQYVVLRFVPRVDREEFVNVGVVLFSPEEDFLGVRWHLDSDRLRALDPEVDPAQVSEGLEAIGAVCSGTAHLGLMAGQRATAYGTREVADTLGTRFGLLKAPRSTAIQPGPVHGGLTEDAAAELDRLLERYVR